MTGFLPPSDRTGGVYALGNFDGVHRGHHAVAEAAIAKAQELGTFPAALTFEPHPRTFFYPECPPFRLTPAPVKQDLLRRAGFKTVETLPFNASLAQMSAEDFAQKILVARFHARHIVAGSDFVFGYGRSGNIKLLRDWLAQANTGVSEVAPLCDAANTRYSASRVRDLLREGRPQDAAALLGRFWSVTGEVVRGDQRGRELGYPTANIVPGSDLLRPKSGVYAVLARPCGGKDAPRRPGVANFGVRPTLGGTTPRLETHIFDFKDDLYGQTWEIMLLDFLRPERKFASLEELRAAIEADALLARQRLARTNP